uniref:Histone H3 n=1 Tax=Panagrellus redivivus TaxID=6233 RepID=A0A7E4VQQ3_PANRE
MSSCLSTFIQSDPAAYSKRRVDGVSKCFLKYVETISPSVDIRHRTLKARMSVAASSRRKRRASSKNEAFLFHESAHLKAVALLLGWDSLFLVFGKSLRQSCRILFFEKFDEVLAKSSWIDVRYLSRVGGDQLAQLQLRSRSCFVYTAFFGADAIDHLLNGTNDRVSRLSSEPPSAFPVPALPWHPYS